MGTQKVSKFRESAAAANTVFVILGVLRLHNAMTDIVLSLSSPLDISQSSSYHFLKSSFFTFVSYSEFFFFSVQLR
jgi:hypothetical protein